VSPPSVVPIPRPTRNAWSWWRKTRETDAKAQEHLRQQIDAMIVDLLGTSADDVVLAPPQTVLKTSSGKVRRAACRERYEQATSVRPQRAVWWQITRLAWRECRRACVRHGAV